MLRGILCFVAVAAISGFTHAAGKSSAEKSIGRKIDDFKLRDYRGKQHALSDYRKSKLVVIAVTGTDCPLVKLYGPRLQELASKYKSKGVQFLGMNSNLQDSVTQVAAYARIHKITFPILKDPGNAIADRLSAVRTPEVFVLDRQRKIRYRGRIDDQYDIGVIKPKVSHADLVDALDELLAGKKVTTPVTQPVGCLIGRVSRVKPHGNITYSNQIARVLQRNCVSCHRKGDIAPFPLTSYKEVVGWAEMMEEVIDDNRMPPWNANPKHGTFRNDARMSAADKKLFRTWVKNGCPEGDKKNLPKPLKFADGWHIGKPDVVFAMRKTPYKVPAEGVVAYKYFTVDTNFKEDKWIKAAEARPGNRSVVHHIVAFVQSPRGGGFRGTGVAVGFAPGTPARIYPKGVARKIPAGSRLVFQMHYTPNGSPQEDISSVGFVFADPKEVKHEVRGGTAMNKRLRIPPKTSDHKVTSQYRFRSEQMLVSMSPHMHLRGKSFRFEAHYPDGKKEILLDVPRYDFNWQLRYDLAKPKRMPKGTRLLCTAYFDNSKHNLNNPDPSKTVYWGDQTWEEMMIGWFTTIVEKR